MHICHCHESYIVVVLKSADAVLLCQWFCLNK